MAWVPATGRLSSKTACGWTVTKVTLTSTRRPCPAWITWAFPTASRSTTGNATSMTTALYLSWSKYTFIIFSFEKFKCTYFIHVHCNCSLFIIVFGACFSIYNRVWRVFKTLNLDCNCCPELWIYRMIFNNMRVIKIANTQIHTCIKNLRYIIQFGIQWYTVLARYTVFTHSYLLHFHQY